MVAPVYSEARSTLAIERGFGRRRARQADTKAGIEENDGAGELSEPDEGLSGLGRGIA